MLFYKEVATLFKMLKRIKDDVNMVFEQDPAARTTLEVVTSYAGVHAVWSHLIAHELYKRKICLSEINFTNYTLLQVLKFTQAPKSVDVYSLTMVWA